MGDLTRLSVIAVLVLSYIFHFFFTNQDETKGAWFSYSHEHNENASTTTELNRGVTVSKRVQPQELYDAYQVVRDDFDQKAFCSRENKLQKPSLHLKCNGEWEWDTLRETEDGIQVSILQDPSDPHCPYVRITGDMSGTSEDTWNFLGFDNWQTTMPKMDPFYEGLDVKQRYLYHKPKLLGLKAFHPVEMILGRKRYHRLGLFGKRDFTFVQVSDLPRDDGVRVSGTISVITDKLPRMKGYTRAFQNLVAFYEELTPEKDDTPKTKVTVVGRIDLNDSLDDGDGGHIPMWLYVKTVGRTGVYFCRNMRKELERIIKKRKLEGTSTDAMKDPMEILRREANTERNVENIQTVLASFLMKKSNS